MDKDFRRLINDIKHSIFFMKLKKKGVTFVQHIIMQLEDIMDTGL